MNTLVALDTFQTLLINAFSLRHESPRVAGEETETDEEFEFALLKARLFLKSARQSVDATEACLFLGAAKKSFEVIKKCSRLGLRNYKARLREYRINETLESALVLQRKARQPMLPLRSA